MPKQTPPDEHDRAAPEGASASLADALFRDLFREAAIGIYRSSADGRPIFANDAFVRMMGYETEADWLKAAVDIARDWYVDPARRAAFVAEIERTGKVTNFVSEIYRHATGEIIWVSETARVVRDGRGATRFYEGTIEDITPRIRAEEALRRAKEEAERAGRLKTDFLAHMSHELRTPLNGILGMAELLAGTRLDERQQQYADILARSGETLLCIINDILDFSKIDAGKMALSRTPFDFRVVAEDVACLLAPRALAKGLEFALHIAPEAETHVVGDEQRIRQILLNLVGNAVKFTDRGHVVLSADVRTEAGVAEIAAEVIDTGIGIPADARARIFDKFEQADLSATRLHGGTGLGLAIARELARLMGGDITVTSEVGAGSTFRLRLRVDLAGVPTSSLPPPRAVGRVLVVDACEWTRRTIGAFVRHWGGSALLVPDVAAAAAAVDALPRSARMFDAACIDGGRANADGAAILAALRALPGATFARTVLIARMHERADRIAQGAAGYDRCLLKPIRAADLAAIFAERSELRRDPAPEPPPASPSRKLRVLLAEDNLVNRMVVRSLLGPHADVVEVENGADAVDAARAGGFDAVLMDISMPVLDGVAATRALRSGGGPGAAVPVIGLTAHVLDDQRRRCLEVGMDDFLTKPVRREDLLSALARATARAGQG